MNKLIIIGNLTRDPQMSTTSGGIAVCNMTVAVNRRSAQQDQTDYIRVTTWRQQAESCARYLTKGSRVCCWGPVTVSTYQGRDGKTYASMEMTGEGVEFCGTSRRQQEPPEEMEPPAEMTAVDEDVPF